MSERDREDETNGDEIEMESEYVTENRDSDSESERREIEGRNGSNKDKEVRRSGAVDRKDFDSAIGEIKSQVAVISGAVSQEGKGKLSFNRADQLAVKGALVVIQSEVIEVLLRQLALERENARIKEEMTAERNRRMEEERKRLEAERRTKRMEEELERAARRRDAGKEDERQKSVTGVVPRRPKVHQVRSETESESERETRSVARTYAQVSAKGRTKVNERGLQEGRGESERGIRERQREEERTGGENQGKGGDSGG